MKKIIIAAAALVAMTACNKNIIEVSNPEAGFGTINLGVTANEEIVVTKADSDVNTDNYQVTLYNSEGISQGTKLYSAIKTDGWKVAAGDYTLKVENILENTIYDVEKGQVYIAGESAEAFKVIAGVATEQTVNCAVKNSKVSFVYTAEFLEVFPTYTLNVTSGEKSFSLTMLQDDADRTNLDYAFFAPGSVTWNLAATKADDSLKNYTSNFTTTAATWTIVTFDVGSTAGTINVKIEVDGTITEVNISATLDPMSEGVTIE